MQTLPYPSGTVAWSYKIQSKTVLKQLGQNQDLTEHDEVKRGFNGGEWRDDVPRSERVPNESERCTLARQMLIHAYSGNSLTWCSTQGRGEKASVAHIWAFPTGADKITLFHRRPSSICPLMIYKHFRQQKYRAPGKSLYVVARNFFLLLLNCSAWHCLGPA